MTDCPACKFSNRESAKHCVKCGTALTASLGSAASSRQHPSGHGSGRGVQIAGVAVAAVALVGAAYWYGTKPSATNYKQELKKEISVKDLTPPDVRVRNLNPLEAPPATTPAAAQAQTIPRVEPPSERPVQRPVAPSPDVKPPTTIPRPAPSPVVTAARQPASAIPMTAINASLAEADGCYAQKRYECAISSANAALRLDPNNVRAHDLKRRAELEQKRALDSISIR